MENHHGPSPSAQISQHDKDTHESHVEKPLVSVTFLLPEDTVTMATYTRKSLICFVVSEG